MTMSLEAAAQAMREAMRETVKRHSLWYLIQGVLMVLGGVLALVYPIVSNDLCRGNTNAPSRSLWCAPMSRQRVQKGAA
jgi:hypothetical protein